MPLPFLPAIHRLRVQPEEPAEKAADAPCSIPAAPRPSRNGQASRRPHADAKTAQVRRLIEQTTLTYSEIAARTGVGRASISRWSRDGCWHRPLDAPRATDRVPTARAGQKLKLRKLAERLRMLAERMVRQLEDTPGVDCDRLMQALEVLKMARLEAQGRRRMRRAIAGRTRTGAQDLSEQEAIRTALKEMRRGGVNLERVPKEAMDLLINAKTPVEDHPALRERGKR